MRCDLNSNAPLISQWFLGRATSVADRMRSSVVFARASSHANAATSLSLRFAVKACAVLGVSFLLASLSEQKAAAQVFKYIVVVDEAGDLKSYYSDKGGLQERKDPPTIGKDGIPTWASKENFVIAGDVVISEPDSDKISDLIRFPNPETDPKKPPKPAFMLQFYSDIGDGTEKDPDVQPPIILQTNKIFMKEEALKQGDMLRVQSNNTTPFDPKLDFRGRWGVMYTVATGSGRPGESTDAKRSPILYVFISDKDQITSGGKSVHYDAATKQLSFTNDFVKDTGSPGDPIVTASVNMPTLRLDHTNPDGSVVFVPVGGHQMTITLGTDVYMRADVGSLTYSKSDNRFSANLSNYFFAGVDITSPYYDPTLTAIDSPVLHYFDSVFNPESGLLDPAAFLSISYAPDLNVFTDTSGFTLSGESPITNTISVQDTPEPTALLIVSTGVLASMAWRAAVRVRRRHVRLRA